MTTSNGVRRSIRCGCDFASWECVGAHHEMHGVCFTELPAKVRPWLQAHGTGATRSLATLTR